MGALTNKRIKYILLSILLILFGIIMSINSMLTNKLNKQFANTVEYNTDKGFHCEWHDDYYIMAGEAKQFNNEICSAVEVNDIFYSNENNTISISLRVYANKFGKYTYVLGFGDYDEGKEEFGGYAYIDENLTYLPENQYDTEKNEYLQKLIQTNKKYIFKLTKIANERWGLNLKSEE